MAEILNGMLNLWEAGRLELAGISQGPIAQVENASSVAKCHGFLDFLLLVVCRIHPAAGVRVYNCLIISFPAWASPEEQSQTLWSENRS